MEDENNLAEGWENCVGGDPDSHGKYNALGHVGYFWSSTIGRFDENKAWGINFYSAGIYSINKADNENIHINADGIYVVCITGNTGDTGDTGDTGNTGESSWTDNETGYTWSEAVHWEMNRSDAINYCDSLTEDGISNWRLPTISELRTLVINCPATETGGQCQVTDDCLESLCSDDSCSGCEWAGDGKYSKLNDTAWFWSSSEQSDNTGFGWGLNFFLAFVGDGGFHNPGSVRCIVAY